MKIAPIRSFNRSSHVAATILTRQNLNLYVFLIFILINFFIDFKAFAQELINPEQEFSEREQVPTHLKEDMIEDPGQLQLLKTSEQGYLEILANYPDSENTNAVKLNLAQVYFIQGKLVKDSDERQGLYEKARDILLQLKELKSNFRQIDQVMYLLAICDERLGNSSKAIKNWEDLANLKSKSIYGILALVAMGDYYFHDDQNKKAYDLFLGAFNGFRKLNSQGNQLELLKLNYRLLWASYRSGVWDSVKKYGQLILDPDQYPVSSANVTAMRQDAVQLVGDVLFEMDSPNIIIKELSHYRFRKSGGAVSLQILERFLEHRRFSEIISIGRFAEKKFFPCMEQPKILDLIATSYEASNEPRNARLYLSKLSALLPANNLWRNRFHENPQAIQDMESLALSATSRLSQTYYKTGREAQDREFLRSSFPYLYRQKEFEKDPLLKAEIDFRIGKVYFETGKFQQSQEVFESIKSNAMASKTLQKQAAYHLCLSDEKLARLKLLSHKRTTAKSPHDNAQNLLKTCVNEFTATYGDDELTHNLSLLTANLMKDFNYDDDAIKYWSTLLGSSADQTYRSLAIRGILLTRLQSKHYVEAISDAKKFLRSNDIQNEHLKSEVLQILSTSVLIESNTLNQATRTGEAANLLLETLNEFPSLPKGAELARNASFFLAFSGSWREAYKALRSFGKLISTEYPSDYLYLKSRVLEYLFEFNKAAESYLELAQKYPNHNKVEFALAQASHLFSAENAHDKACQAIVLAANRSKDIDSKVDYLQQAIGHLILMKRYDDAEKTANQIVKTPLRYDLGLKGYLSLSSIFSDADDLVSHKKTVDQALKYIKNNQSKIEMAQVQDTIGRLILNHAFVVKRLFDRIDLGSTRSGIEEVRKKNLIYNSMKSYLEIGIEYANPMQSHQTANMLVSLSSSFRSELRYIENVKYASDFSKKSLIKSMISDLVKSTEKYSKPGLSASLDVNLETESAAPKIEIDSLFLPAFYLDFSLPFKRPSDLSSYRGGNP